MKRDCCEKCWSWPADKTPEEGSCGYVLCVCHKIQDAVSKAVDEMNARGPQNDLEKEFVRRFYVSNLETGSPAGAEKDALDFIRKNYVAKTEAFEQGRQAGLKEVMDALPADEIIDFSDPDFLINRWAGWNMCLDKVRKEIERLTIT